MRICLRLPFIICYLVVASALAQTITEFPLPNGGNTPAEIAAGPDGALWFTEESGKIGRITTGGVITEFPVPTPTAAPVAIVAGPDGNLWFTQFNDLGLDPASISRITLAGDVTRFLGPSLPIGLAVGSDGNLWFTESANKIGRITTTGLVTEFALPAGAGPKGITAGPDGNLWFTESANKIGRITTAGAITEFSIPTLESEPVDITAGPDGSLWFTEGAANKIGRITTSGVVTEFPIRRRGAFPSASPPVPTGTSGSPNSAETRSDGSSSV